MRATRRCPSHGAPIRMDGWNELTLKPGKTEDVFIKAKG